MLLAEVGCTVCLANCFLSCTGLLEVKVRLVLSEEIGKMSRLCEFEGFVSARAQFSERDEYPSIFHEVSSTIDCMHFEHASLG
jgi:hypothetical protein